MGRHHTSSSRLSSLKFGSIANWRFLITLIWDGHGKAVGIGKHWKASSYLLSGALIYTLTSHKMNRMIPSPSVANHSQTHLSLAKIHAQWVPMHLVSVGSDRCAILHQSRYPLRCSALTGELFVIKVNARYLGSSPSLENGAGNRKGEDGLGSWARASGWWKNWCLKT